MLIMRFFCTTLLISCKLQHFKLKMERYSSDDDNHEMYGANDLSCYTLDNPTHEYSDITSIEPSIFGGALGDRPSHCIQSFDSIPPMYNNSMMMMQARKYFYSLYMQRSCLR